MTIRTFEIEDKELRISQDENPDNPREWDNLCTMACFHRRYNLGDRHDFKSPEELESFVARDSVIALPLYLYDHGG